MMTAKKIYFIGIKGVGMSGAAVIAKEAGHSVQGSDVPEQFITDKILHEKGIAVLEGFDAAHLDWRYEPVRAPAPRAIALGRVAASTRLKAGCGHSRRHKPAP